MIRNKTPEFVKKQHNILSGGKLGPSQILVIGFLSVIMIGTGLLMLPISSHTGQNTIFIDALFTATSAVCVTGLVVVNTLEHWSIFGKAVILMCIQIGGLGFMTLVSMIFILMKKKITLKSRLLMQEALNLNTTAGIVRFSKGIVWLTMLVELIGAAFLSIVFIPEYGLQKGIAYAIFHSVSAFCNAGFDLIGPNSLMPYVGNGIVNFTVMGLIVASGLGFSVWVDTYKMFNLKKDSAEHFTWRQAICKLSLHTKLVWVLTVSLISIGFIFFFLVEYTNPATLGSLSFKGKIYAALFQSITSRTAGFCTISLSDLTQASKLMTIILMFIGGSPGGTAGGVKTVTVGILIMCAICTIKGREHIDFFKRRIPLQIIVRALTIVMIAFTIIIVMLMILTFTENVEFLDMLFEVVSAFATVGITVGITPNLSFVGKIIIIILMFIGRLGPVTIAVALSIRQSNQKGNILYPEEKVLVG